MLQQICETGSFDHSWISPTLQRDANWSSVYSTKNGLEYIPLLAKKRRFGALLVSFRNKHKDFPSCLTCPSLDSRPHIWKRVFLIIFRHKFYKKYLPVPHAFSFTIMAYLTKFVGIKCLNTKKCLTGVSPRIIPLSLYPLFYQERAK